MFIRQLSLYCLVDEVLRRGEIMPDEEKKLTFHYYSIFSSDMPKNQRNFFPKLHQFQLNLFIFTIKSHFPTFFLFFPPTRVKILFFIFIFFLRRGTKLPCRSSSTKQYSESCLKKNNKKTEIFTLEVIFRLKLTFIEHFLNSHVMEQSDFY